MNITIWSAMGLLGVGLYLVAYGALQFGFLRGSSAVYTLLNMAAAFLVLLSLIEAFNLSSMVLQVAWILLSIIGLGRMAWRRSRLSFTEDERGMLAQHFTTLPPEMARRLFSLGQWREAGPGTVVTRQGASVHELTYIARGQAQVRAHGQEVAVLGPGHLIGEMAIIHGGVATADVALSESARLFTLPRANLLRELRQDHDFALSLSNALQLEAQRKLDSANKSRAKAMESQNA